MVYLREIIQSNKSKILQYKNIELVAYLFVASPQELINYEFELTLEEEISLMGYKKQSVDAQKISALISKPPVKGISATSNVYKFAGLYLADKASLENMLKEKFNQSDLKQKYFLSKFQPDLLAQLRKDVESNQSPISIVIKQILGFENIAESDLNSALQELVKIDFDIQIQILMEDLEKSLLKTKYANKSAEELIRDVLNNFSNSIQKIIKDRRKNHPNFQIEDEYDVQDILYVILKSVFPTLRDEDPIPKVGAKSTKIDLILREEKILVEVKMIKKNDSNEKEFIEQLKIDFESYHECQWLGKLFCFVYDPYKKTNDVSNFDDLNGERKKGGHSFDVELIVAN
ncbi:MAG: hypothetical protein ABIQ40_16925 [Bacteroidia bacterium]